MFNTVKALDGDSKALFGQYIVPRVKEWYDIVHQFERGNVYLAECAQQLARAVNYEVPALKQQISRCKQTQRVRACVPVCVCVCVMCGASFLPIQNLVHDTTIVLRFVWFRKLLSD